MYHSRTLYGDAKKFIELDEKYSHSTKIHFFIHSIRYNITILIITQIQYSKLFEDLRSNIMHSFLKINFLNFAFIVHYTNKLSNSSVHFVNNFKKVEIKYSL